MPTKRCCTSDDCLNTIACIWVGQSESAAPFFLLHVIHFFNVQTNTKMSNQKITLPTGNTPRTVQVPPFLIEYTSELDLYLELKRSFTEMFCEWVVSANFKCRSEDQDYSPEIYMYVQELFGEMYRAQKDGKTEIILTLSSN